MFTFACFLRVLSEHDLVTLHHSVCMLLSSHWLKQSSGGCAGPIRVRENTGSSGGGRGRSHAAKERISGGGRGGGARAFKVSDWPMRRSTPFIIATVVTPPTPSVCCCDLPHRPIYAPPPPQVIARCDCFCPPHAGRRRRPELLSQSRRASVERFVRWDETMMMMTTKSGARALERR